jgi:DNA polymerase
MAKTDVYRSIIAKRKSCRLCDGLTNPSAVANGEYDSAEIGPWSRWQGNINAEILVVGQDWGDIRYFMKWQGKDQPSGNPTNDSLQVLLKHIGVQIGKPRETQDHVVFFTNLILCLKQGGLQAKVDDGWFRNCTSAFFQSLIDVIQPKAILALGKKVSESILNQYDIAYPKSKGLLEIMRQSPYSLTSTTVLFPLYHCGAGSVNRNRSIIEQKTDWSRVGEWLKKN